MIHGQWQPISNQEERAPDNKEQLISKHPPSLNTINISRIFVTIKLVNLKFVLKFFLPIQNPFKTLRQSTFKGKTFFGSLLEQIYSFDITSLLGEGCFAGKHKQNKTYLTAWKLQQIRVRGQMVHMHNIHDDRGLGSPSTYDRKVSKIILNS